MDAESLKALKDAMKGAQVFGKGQYLEDGRYLLKAFKIFYKRTLIEGTAKESIICEFTVMESSNPQVEAGSTRTVIHSKHLTGFMSRLKAMILAIMGLDPDSNLTQAQQDGAAEVYAALVSPEYRAQLGLPDNFLADRCVYVEAIPGKSKRGTDVTNLKWRPVPVAAESSENGTTA